MHPALSVVFFTSVSGAGYGLLALLGLLLLLEPLLLARGATLWLLATGTALASAGLLASLAHLGQPRRAWRALSQWRSSWLSREGVCALFAYLPIGTIAALLLLDGPALALRAAGALLLALALATVACTARIYTSLAPVPAWQHPLVLPGYLGFAFASGLLWWGLLLAAHGWQPEPGWYAVLALALGGLAGLKRAYWRDIDRAPLPTTLASATGIAGAPGLRPFEAPHTETNYLLREMGYVLARRHRGRLRALTLPLLLAPLVIALPTLFGAAAVVWLLPALFAAQLGVLVERWLFFAEARHVVTVYYRGG
jgi:sulfite dehydrogenase (quinone) subunit SoeC